MKTMRYTTACAVALAAIFSAKPQAHAGMIGINVLLNQRPSDAILADLATHGQVLDILPEIKAITLRAQDSELPAIQALPYVASAISDRRFTRGQPQEPPQGPGQPGEGLPMSDFADGANIWNLDAINVTDVGGGRSVAYDGEGVYIAVIDSGLPQNWREYFPEERIATEYARAFEGGGGEQGNISSQPDKWERDSSSHGASMPGIILGFRYSGPELLPAAINGVAPKVRVIPLDIYDHALSWNSKLIRAILYTTDLKRSGMIGPLVISMTWADYAPDAMLRAAVNYAIGNGVIFVASAGSTEHSIGMLYPAAWPEVISVGASGWVEQLPADDPTEIVWILRDVAESGVMQHFIAPFSPRELPGQEMDLVAPGMATPVPRTVEGKVDYRFTGSTSQASAHVAGVAALMLQKNPSVTQSQVEGILVSTAMPIPPGCRNMRWPAINPAAPGDEQTWSDHSSVSYFDATFCWEANTTGAGLVQADAALAATPMP